MSFTQFFVGMLIPPLVRWSNKHLKNYFKLTEIDALVKERITSKSYPSYYSILYGLWIIALLSNGIIELLFMIIYGPNIFPGKSFAVHTFLGLINMIGVWFIAGAILDFLVWGVSTANFRDYAMFRQLKSGWPYDMKQQISTILKLGILYYLITTPLMIVIYLFLK